MDGVFSWFVYWASSQPTFLQVAVGMWGFLLSLVLTATGLWLLWFIRSCIKDLKGEF